MKQLNPWFGYERTLEQQWTGLDGIEWSGKSVLDLGCAEGMICKRAIERGARSVTGLELRQDYVEQANKGATSKEMYVPFNLNNDLGWVKPCDIVLMLAVLHKLPNPLARLEYIANTLCLELAVIRLPPKTGPVIVDERSGFVPFDTRPVMEKAGFKLEREHYEGPKGEWMGYWRRVV